MDWITDIKTLIKEEYDINPEISECFSVRYKKFHNRASFYFRLSKEQTTTRFNYNDHDYVGSSHVRSLLYAKLGDNIKVRNEWLETYVYFNNLEDLLDAIPQEHLKKLAKLEMMNPYAIEAIKTFEHEYPVSLTVSKKLPFNRYRYRVYVTNSGKVRRSIGPSNLRHIFGALNNYSGIKFTQCFKRYHDKEWTYIPSLYFYAESLDWLPIIVLTEPRYVTRIEEIKTSKEIENESAIKNSTRT